MPPRHTPPGKHHYRDHLPSLNKATRLSNPLRMTKREINRSDRGGVGWNTKSGEILMINLTNVNERFQITCTNNFLVGWAAKFINMVGELSFGFSAFGSKMSSGGRQNAQLQHCLVASPITTSREKPAALTQGRSSPEEQHKPPRE